MSWIQDLPDDTLLTGLRKGDKLIFDRLFKGTYRKIVFYAYKCMGQDPDLEFIANGTFIKVWEHRGQFESIGHLRSFMYSVTRNECISRFRKERTAQDALEEMDFLADPGNEQPDLDLVHADIIEMVFSSMEGLPALYGKILRQTVLEGKPHNEIAADLSITPNLVTVKKFRALTLLRSMLIQLGISL